MSVVLSEHLPLLASAPEGIQKLRGLILELAVRGKLVPQDPEDEPAQVLLKRIAEERARLETQGICKKSKPPFPDSTKTPFALPTGWSWVRLSEIGHDWGQKTPDADFTYVDVSAIDNSKGSITSPTVMAPTDAPSRARKIVQQGTVIYSTIRPYLLNIAVIDRDLTPPPIASTAFAVIHPLAGLSSQYIFWYLRSPVFVRYVESVQTGIAYPAVNDSQFFSGLFPLPPLAEQHRIVAKVDELMALCDRLAGEQADAEAAHARLVETLLGTLTQSRDATELAANWQRLSQHFATLFTTEPSLDTLKQTILQLAVMGKLVPQDPNDEPASELLRRIATERAGLEAEGICKKSKPMPLVNENDQPFVLPNGWMWLHLGAVVDIKGGKRVANGYQFLNSPTPYIYIRVSDMKDGSIDDSDLRYIDEEMRKVIERYIIRKEDIYMTIVGATIGKCGLVPEKFDGMNLTENAARLIVSPAADRIFLYKCLASDFCQKQFIDKTKQVGVQKMALNRLAMAVIPLPPIPEQHRIVAKVDELMSLCDNLKADLAEARTQQARLATTLIESALKAA